MQLFVTVIKNSEYVEPILRQMAESGFSGATVLDSSGMAQLLKDEDDLPFFGGLRTERLHERAKSTTVFAVMEDERIEEARAIVNRVTGGLNRPDSGIMFALPVSFADGILHPDGADPAS